MYRKPLDGYPVEMFDFDNKTDLKPLKTFESIGKAGRFYGEMNSAKFSKIVYKRLPVEITWQGRKKKVIFKEKV